MEKIIAIIMSDKFQNKYRNASARLQYWDYGWNAAYYVTICTKNRECFFGHIVGTRLIASLPGQIANDCWLAIPDHFQYARLGTYVVMPNHVHGIVFIEKPDGGNPVPPSPKPKSRRNHRG